MFPPSLLERAAAFLDACRARSLRVATAESCTGGLLSGLLTEIAGSSDVFERGFVVYSNDAKRELLGVPGHLIARHGAVSEACARALAEGAVEHSHAQIAVSVTGVAGPGGGTLEKPVGLVYFALAHRGHPTIAREKRFGPLPRGEIRLASVDTALAMLEAAAF